MQTIKRGYIYDLENKGSGTQRITFFKDLPVTEIGHDGILCQELLRALIDRVFDLNEQQPCHENVEIINKLREVLILFETSAARRLMEKSYSKTGLNVEELPVDKRGHVLQFVEN